MVRRIADRDRVHEFGDDLSAGFGSSRLQFYGDGLTGFWSAHLFAPVVDPVRRVSADE
jgi:hypothetical protein